MRRFLFFISCLLVLCSAICSCEKEESPRDYLIGTWKVTKEYVESPKFPLSEIIPEPPASHPFYYFDKNGSGKEFYVQNSVKIDNIYDYKFTFSKNDNTITVEYLNPNMLKFNPLTLNISSMTKESLVFNYTLVSELYASGGGSKTVYLYCEKVDDFLFHNNNYNNWNYLLNHNSSPRASCEVLFFSLNCSKRGN